MVIISQFSKWQKNYNHTVTLEKPCAIHENKGEYYYPVKTKKSRKIYEKYKKKSANLEKVTFIGRTGLFRYIDMAPAVNIHIKIANDFIRKIAFKSQIIKKSGRRNYQFLD